MFFVRFVNNCYIIVNVIKGSLNISVIKVIYNN